MRDDDSVWDNFFCFDHGISYSEEQLMCPKCESEICELGDEALDSSLDYDDFEVRGI